MRWGRYLWSEFKADMLESADECLFIWEEIRKDTRQSWARVKESSALRNFFDFSRTTRRILLGMFFFGLVFGLVLWLIDLGALVITKADGKTRYDAAWLNNHAYIPNILAGATGFLIGVPVALVILASFTAQREDKATLNRVNRLSAGAWDSFRALVNDFASDKRLDLLSNQARDIGQHYEQTAAAIDSYIALANQLLGTPDAVELRENLEYLKDLEPKFRVAVNALRQNINFHETHDEWAQIVGAWRVLDQYVRLQRLEQGLEWFDKRSDAGFGKCTSRSGNPLQDLLDAIEIRLYTPNTTLNVDTMANALDTLHWYTRFEDAAHLGEYLLSEGNIFTRDRSTAYHARADAARLFILDLKRYIGLVEIMFWPRAQIEPVRTDAKYEQTMPEWIGSLQYPDGEKQFKRAWFEAVSQHKRELRKQRIERMRSRSKEIRNTASKKLLEE